jgi:hypothetical protein
VEPESEVDEVEGLVSDLDSVDFDSAGLDSDALDSDGFDSAAFASALSFEKLEAPEGERWSVE